MTLSPAFLDELRARVTLSSVIAPHVKLTRAGREWKACCPFHNEKTPSFTVNDEKHFYHCFGCSAHGDAIRFLTDSRGLPFMDAVKELAAIAGMEVPAADPRSRERAERQATLHDVMAAAQRWFAEQLHGIDGGEARAYLKQRGIDSVIHLVLSSMLGEPPRREYFGRTLTLALELAEQHRIRSIAIPLLGATTDSNEDERREAAETVVDVIVSHLRRTSSRFDSIVVVSRFADDQPVISAAMERARRRSWVE